MPVCGVTASHSTVLAQNPVEVVFPEVYTLSSPPGETDAGGWESFGPSYAITQWSLQAKWGSSASKSHPKGRMALHLKSPLLLLGVPVPSLSYVAGRANSGHLLASSA